MKNRNGYMGAKHMTGEGFALLVKAYVEAVGLDPERFSGHSLRAGFATSAAAAGKSLSNATEGLGDPEDET